ncbi:MAG: NDMA-dependent alcohol dehydrogenase [Actinobacteria bacterium]|jgi:S-(hydroxymethyl)glutathione dehydrogenase/alcohol dehydrogenase|nr:NDMA-dependent alcohol dehydrogenase [Actinomycetota bacterium]MCL6095959.1 NDMA-dependent alcohol dehydrogenase [Actinomycetota bacterium]
MRTQAAVLWELNTSWSVEEVELDDPVEGEVLVKLAASGLCHSDEHLLTGDIPAPLPMVGGHEGAGIVEAVGPGVNSLSVGDHVVLAFIPACGRCPSCSSGHQNLCDLGANLVTGIPVSNGIHRIRAKGQGAGAFCLLGTFSPYVVVNEASAVKIDDDIPLDKAALVGCGVTTGYGSAVYAAEVAPGDTVVVVGCGGVGMNAIQGARLAGAERIVAVDPVAFKREQASVFGATHSAPDLGAAYALVNQLTWGRLADKAIITTSVASGDLIAPTMSLISKGGRVVVTAVAPFLQSDVQLSLFELTLFQKDLRGSIFGSANPRYDMPRILDLYREGKLKLDELITRTYSLAEVNQGYQDMRDGKNIRGVILFE